MMIPETFLAGYALVAWVVFAAVVLAGLVVTLFWFGKEQQERAEAEVAIRRHAQERRAA